MPAQKHRDDRQCVYRPHNEVVESQEPSEKCEGIMKRILAASTAIAVAAAITAALAVPQPETRSAFRSAAASATAGSVERVNMRVSQLEAGADVDDVERILGRPTTMERFDEASGDNRALIYADQPVRTRITIKGGRVTEIALDLAHIDETALPTHGRMVQSTMTRGGLLALLGKPIKVDKWTESGLEIEQMAFKPAGERDFSVFLVGGVVVDVRPGAERPSGIARVVLPAPILDTPAEADLRIGMTPQQAAHVLGEELWRTTYSFKGQTAVYAVYQTTDGHGRISVTFARDTLTAFVFWPAGIGMDVD